MQNSYITSDKSVEVLTKRTLDFAEYLHKIGHTDQTIKSYLHINRHIQKDDLNLSEFSYKNVIDYLAHKSKQSGNGKKQITLLNGLKKYFDYLIEIGVRETHPCKGLYIRNIRKKGIIHQDLFSSEELELLMMRKERYQSNTLKHQIIISLLIYQGLRSGEICRLKTRHIHLAENYIYIKESKKISARIIPIHPSQVFLFEKYTEQRSNQSMIAESEIFLYGKSGMSMSVDSVNYTVEIFRPMFPHKTLTASSIRKSVIANWLNEKKLPLEQVQILSGQKWISSTAIYRKENFDEQRELMNKWFPI